MLGAAHVLAMDSKNLLDVVDAIRIRYPELCQNLLNHIDQVDGAKCGLDLKEEPKVESPSAYPKLVGSPVPVSCSFVPVYSNNVHSATTSSSLSTNQIDS